MRWLSLFIALSIISSNSVFAKENELEPVFNPDEVRKLYWNFGLTGSKHNLISGNEFEEIKGNSLDVSIGSGYIDNRKYFFGTVDFVMGPFEEAKKIHIDVDYKGVGATFWSGYSAQKIDLRSPLGGYGFSLGLKYSDVRGKSIGLNKKQKVNPNDPDNEGLIDDYSIRSSTFSVIPGIFFCWLEDWRPSGNDPELLKTRLEGLILTIGVNIPIQSSYTSEFNIATKDKDTGNIIQKNQKQKGTMSGYSILVNLTALLGI